jgi:predicted nucleic acid-binding Zn ribbon protein
MTRQPTHIAEVLSELMARRGFARVESAAALEDAWKRAAAALPAGQLMAEHTRVGKLGRGRLEILVAHSALLQELEFQKKPLLDSLRKQLPEHGIADLRFRIGATQ